MLEEELGLSAEQSREAVLRLAGTMDLALSGNVGAEQLRTVTTAVAALTMPPCAGDEGPPQ